jgi:quercetin dioxygenase-like cupin family protein
MSTLLRLPRALFPAAVLIAAAAASAAGPAAVTVIASDQLQYRVDPKAPGAAIAVVAGDPQSGPYTIRVRFSAGATTPPHRHPDERTVTVLSGRYAFAVGERYEATALQVYDAGTVLVVPAGTPHFSAAPDGETVVQESGVGPTGLELLAQ